VSDDKAILWWKSEIPRLQVEIKSLDYALARATYEPTLQRIKERMRELQGELDNALRVAEAHARAQETGTAPQKLQEFTCLPDYRCVTVRGKSYTLTPRQAHIVEILHMAYTDGHGDVGIDFILEQLGTANSRWQDTFKTNREARKALVRPGSRKGTLRLNL